MRLEVHFRYLTSSLQYKFTNQNLGFSGDVPDSTGVNKKTGMKLWPGFGLRFVDARAASAKAAVRYFWDCWKGEYD